MPLILEKISTISILQKNVMPEHIFSLMKTVWKNDRNKLLLKNDEYEFINHKNKS